MAPNEKLDSKTNENMLKLSPREEREAEKERKKFEKGAAKDIEKMRAKYPIRPFFAHNFIGKKIANFFFERNIKRAAERLEKKEHQEAKFFIERAFSWKPNSIVCWFYLSTLSKNQGNRARCAIELSCALLLDPTNVSIRAIRAMTFHLLKKEAAALADWIYCLRNEPKDATYWHYIGIEYWFLNQNEKAKSFLQKAVALKPEDTQSLFILGRIAEAKENFEEAYSFFTLTKSLVESRLGEDFVAELERETLETPILKKLRMLNVQRPEIEPQTATEAEEEAEAQRLRFLARFPQVSAEDLEEYESVLSALMTIPNESRDVNETQRLCEKLLVLNRDVEQALMIRAAVDFENKNLDSAYAQFQELRQKYPKNTLSYWFTGEILQELGRFEEAVADYKIAYEKQIHVEDSIYGTITCLQRLERVEELYDFCSKVIREGNATPRVYNSRGMVCLIRQNLEEAEADFRKTLKIKPKDYWGTMNLVVTLFAQNRYKDLLPYSEEILRQKPENMDCRRIRITALQMLGRFEDAKEDIEILYKNDPENVDTMIVATQIYRRCGNLDTAEEYVDCALQRAPKNPFALSERLDLYLLNRNPQGALETVDKLLSLEPNNMEYLTKRGACLAQLERYEEALDTFNSVIKQEPENDEALFGRGECRLRKGQLEAAIVDFQKVRKLNPTSIHPLVLSAEAKVKLGLLEPGLTDLENALEIEPRRDELRLQKIAGLATLKRFEEAFEYVDQIVQKEPENKRMRFQRGSLHTIFNRYEEALADFEYVAEHDTENFEPIFACAVALNSLFRTDEALAKLDEVLKIAPDFIPAMTEKAVILNNTRKVSEGLELLEKILKLDPDNVRVLNLRGTARANDREFEAAVKDFRRVLELEPDYVPAINNLGHLLSLLGKTEEGLEYLNSAIEMAPTWPRPYLNRALLFVRMKQLEDAENDAQKAIDSAQELGDEDSVVDAVNLKQRIQELNEFLKHYEEAEDNDISDYDDDELDIEDELDEVNEFGDVVYSDDLNEILEEENEYGLEQFFQELLNDFGRKFELKENQNSEENDNWEDEFDEVEDCADLNENLLAFFSEEEEYAQIEEKGEENFENTSKSKIDWSYMENMEEIWNLFFEHAPGVKELFADD